MPRTCQKLPVMKTSGLGRHWYPPLSGNDTASVRKEGGGRNDRRMEKAAAGSWDMLTFEAKILSFRGSPGAVGDKN